MNMSQVKVFATSHAEPLADRICAALQTRLPQYLQPNGKLVRSNAGWERFPNGCFLPHIESVRNHLVVILFTQGPNIHDELFELFHLIDAIENADAEEILFVSMHNSYWRSDKKDSPHISVMSRFLADIVNSHPIIRKKLILDAHDDHVLHYFRPAANGVSATLLFADYLDREYLTPERRSRGRIVYSDSGAATRYRQMAQILNLPTAYIDKQRIGGKVIPIGVVGQVDGDCLLFDDEVLTGGTTIGDAEMLFAHGALSVTSLVVHPVLMSQELSTADLMLRLESSRIEKFVYSDSIPVEDKIVGLKKFKVIPVVNLMAEALKRAILGESFADLHSPEKAELYR